MSDYGLCSDSLWKLPMSHITVEVYGRMDGT